MNFNIIAIIDLFKFDSDLIGLKNFLLSIKKTSFDSNDRIVVLHNDTEYFYYSNIVGFTTHNFFNIVRDLDFPLYIFTFLTNHSKFDEAIKPFVSHCDTPTVYNTLVNNVSYYNIKHLTLPVEVKKIIKYKALCLMGVNRAHRTKLFQFLELSKFEDFKYSFNMSLGYSNNFTVPKDNQQVYNSVYSDPHRINDLWSSYSKNNFVRSLNTIPYYKKLESIFSVDNFNFYQHFAIDIVPETVFDYPHVFVSEKTLRPILLETPFVMFGAPGTLKYLQSFGFKTFNDYWDEQYDSITDPGDRFEACCEVVSKINSFSLPELIEIYSSMSNILTHNRIMLINYIDNIYKPLYNNLNVPN